MDPRCRQDWILRLIERPVRELAPPCSRSAKKRVVGSFVSASLVPAATAPSTSPRRATSPASCAPSRPASTSSWSPSRRTPSRDQHSPSVPKRPVSSTRWPTGDQPALITHHGTRQLGAHQRLYRRSSRQGLGKLGVFEGTHRFRPAQSIHAHVIPRRNKGVNRGGRSRQRRRSRAVGQWVHLHPRQHRGDRDHYAPLLYRRRSRPRRQRGCHVERYSRGRVDSVQHVGRRLRRGQGHKRVRRQLLRRVPVAPGPHRSVRSAVPPVPLRRSRELNISIANAALRGIATGSPVGFYGDVVATLKKDLTAGEHLDGEGRYTVWGKLVSARSNVDRHLPMTKGKAMLGSIHTFAGAATATVLLVTLASCTATADGDAPAVGGDSDLTALVDATAQTPHRGHPRIAWRTDGRRRHRLLRHCPTSSGASNGMASKPAPRNSASSTRRST